MLYKMSNSTKTVMQFTNEHVNKRFQAHRFLYCVIIDNENKIAELQLLKKNMVVIVFRN